MKQILQPYLEFFPDMDSITNSVVKFCAFELSAQPRLRKAMKDHLNENAYISTNLTSQGQKDLDLFNPSYRVKLVHKLSLQQLLYQLDLYLDILQCEKTGLVKVEIGIDELKEQQFRDYLKTFYMTEPLNTQDNWNILRISNLQLKGEVMIYQGIALANNSRPNKLVTTSRIGIRPVVKIIRVIFKFMINSALIWPKFSGTP